MNPEISVGNHKIGRDHPTYFIADIAANHDGDLERAKDLIALCAEAGADAAKFQNFRAETIVSPVGFEELGGRLSHQSLWRKGVFEVYDDAALSIGWTETLRDTCDRAGIDYFTAPYDLELLDSLRPFVRAWKLGSGDITWHENIERLAQDGLPLFVATGASEMHEVRLAIDVAMRHTFEIVLMQCNTNYEGTLENFNHIQLRVLTAFAREYPQLVMGLSDHTPGHATVLGAVALGARAIEKHFTDDNSREGPDHAFALNPQDWRDMVDRTRELEAALGTEEKRVMENEVETVVVQRRAIRASRQIPRGKVIEAADLTVLRPCPADALPPYRIDAVVGGIAARDVQEGECVRLEDVA